MERQAHSHYRQRLNPLWAKTIHKPPFSLSPPNSQAKRQGVKYERKVQEELQDRYGLAYLPSVWFCYGGADGERRYCQLDGLLVLDAKRTLVIVECKLKHTSDAYWQIEHCYLPVLRKWLAAEAGWKIATCEVVRWYDPFISFPVRPTLVADVHLASASSFNVHILNKL